MKRKYECEDPLCLGCEKQSRMLAIVAGVVIGKIWLRLFPRTLEEPVDRLLFLVEVSSPLIVVLFYWAWVRFDLKYNWVSRTDNDIYRAIQEWWNRIV
jgi:hypothetical protein